MFLLLGLLGGLVTGISPCILPVLPVLFLGAAGGKDSANATTASSSENTTNAVDPGLFRVAPGVSLGRGGSSPAVTAKKVEDSPSIARRPLLIVAGLVTSFMLITVAGSALLSLLHLPQTAIRWAGIVLLVAVGIGMIVPKVMEVLERPFARLAPRTTGDSAGFGLGLVLGAAFVPCAGPVLASVIVASNTGQVTWRIVGLAVSFAVGLSIPLLAVALAGSGVAASLKAHQRPLRIAAGVAMIALAVGIVIFVIGVLGIVIPVLPGLLLCVAAVLVWAGFTGGTTAWVTFGVVAVIYAVTLLLQFLIPGRRMKRDGVGGLTLTLGVVGAIIGFFVIPVVGLPVGFVLGVFAAEYVRFRDLDRAWQATKAALRGVLHSMGIELSAALLIAVTWTVGIIAH